MENHTISKTRQILRHDVDKLKRNAVQVAQDVRDHAAAHVDETQQRVNDTYLILQENLTTHSLSLLGIGFVIGVLVGFRFRR